MPLIERGPAGHWGPTVVIGAAAVAFALLLLVGSVDFCPDGFVRDCVHAVQGYLDGAACQCIPE